MSGTCKDCVSWRPNAGRGGHSEADLSGMCWRVERADDEHIFPSWERKWSIAWLTTPDAQLQTSPDFGCNMFEAKGE